MWPPEIFFSVGVVTIYAVYDSLAFDGDILGIFCVNEGIVCVVLIVGTPLQNCPFFKK